MNYFFLKFLPKHSIWAGCVAKDDLFNVRVCIINRRIQFTEPSISNVFRIWLLCFEYPQTTVHTTHHDISKSKLIYVFSVILLSSSKTFLNPCQIFMITYGLFWEIVNIWNPLTIFQQKLSHICLRIHWRLSTILKTSLKVYEVMFFYIYIFNSIYILSVFNTLCIEIKHKC